MTDRVMTILIAVITAIWATNFFCSLLIDSYDPSEGVNAIFMGTVGVLFAFKARPHQR